MTQRISRINRQHSVFVHTFQIDSLLRALCNLHSIETPREAAALMRAECSSGSPVDARIAKKMPNDEDANASGEFDDMDIDDFEPLTELNDSDFENEEKAEDETPFKKLHVKAFEQIVRPQ